MRHKITSLLKSAHFQAFLIITAVNLVVFLFLGKPRLMQDDWAVIADGVFSRFAWFDWYQQRPLNNAFYNLLYAAAGTNIVVYHWVNFCLVLGIQYLVYRLADELLVELRPIALVTALIALVYPANYTATWLTMINNHLAWLMALLGMWLLLRFVRQGGFWLLLAGSLFLFVPLWIYEGALGISLAWCLLLLGFSWTSLSRQNRLALLVPIALLSIFAVLRAFIRPMMGIRGVNQAGFSGSNLLLIWDRLLEIKVLAAAWLGPLQPWLSSMGVAIGKLWLLVGLGLVIILVVLLFYLLLRSRKVQESQPIDRSRARRKLLWAFLAAVVLLLASLIPTIFVRPLNLEDATTRSNLYAIPPAAVILACALSALVLLFTSQGSVYRKLVWAAALPLLLSGIGIQAYVQNQWQSAWEQQQSIWRSIFDIAADFEAGTTVVLVMQGYGGDGGQLQGFGTHPPIYAEWEFEDALRVLYEDLSLNGRIYFPAVDYYSEAEFSEDGIFNASRSQTSPYNTVVFLLYREAKGRLSLVNNPTQLLGLPFKIQDYSPHDRILSEPASTWLYRGLVGGEAPAPSP